MLEKFKRFIIELNLFSKNDSILLAVSGGVDSAVMSELFHQSKFLFGIAHCNFQLRKSDSTEDEKFVRELAQKYEVEFFSTTFETSQYADEHKISIQMAARELRYDWLNKIREENNYTYIATAHHQNDSIETVLLNLARGTGISGLHGILPKQEKIIRPLLFAKRKNIEEFSSVNKIVFRQDISNESDKYLRNKLRNQVIPLMKEVNPNFEETMLENIKRFRNTEKIYREAIEIFRQKLFEIKGSEIYISIQKLQKFNPLKTILFELLKDCNFNIQQVEQIIETFEKESGKMFLSSSHRLIKDRVFLIISALENIELNQLLIEENMEKVQLSDLQLKIKNIENKNPIIPKSIKVAYLDFDALEFPLTLKRWSKGDYFYPFGMKKKKKKLSDFFVDLKLSVNEKEKTWVLFSGEKIAWVVGQRIDERFKINVKTKKIYILEKIS